MCNLEIGRIDVSASAITVISRNDVWRIFNQSTKHLLCFEERLFCLLALGDIHVDAQHPQWRPFVVPEYLGHGLDIANRAIGPDYPKLCIERSDARDCSFHFLVPASQ